MRRLTKYTKSIKYHNIAAMLVTALLIFLVVPALQKFPTDGNNMITILLNGKQVGIVGNANDVENMVNEARRRVAKEHSGLVLFESNVILTGSREIFGHRNTPEEIVDNMYTVFVESMKNTKQPVYEIKINEFTVNLRSAEEVIALLRKAKEGYDDGNLFTVDLVLDPTRELNVLTAKVQKTEDIINSENEEKPLMPEAGAQKKINQIYADALKQDVESFHIGILNLDFGENVEVVQAYVDESQISSLDEAIEMVTKEQEKSSVYEVEAGDSLSVIAEKTNTTVEKIIAMNHETIQDENTMLRIGDELKVTVPEPELSVVRTEQVYYEENYEEEIQYIDNDDWYTNEQKVLQQPVAGFRKVVADITYRNNEENGRTIVYEDIVAKAVPKIVERGTKIPPTYMKPISGGRLTSGFGPRKAPKKGASTYHKGIDWAVPTGTAVCASSGGKVLKAGWGSGYGYCVFIQHPDGKVTRYGHLSKVLVKAGQSVRQGEKIALSGNTGVSTGPHLHFEILINGSQVNPMKYL